jgi:hypothetical protein
MLGCLSWPVNPQNVGINHIIKNVGNKFTNTPCLSLLSKQQFTFGLVTRICMYIYIYIYIYMRFDRNSYITLFSKLSFRVYFRKPFRDLPDTFRDAVFSLTLFCWCFFCCRSRQASPGSRIALFGKCSFLIPSGFLPDLTRD